VSDNVVAIEPLSASVARIVYRYDLGRASECYIPLGVIAEATTPSVWALGLIARTSLLPDELDRIGHRIRQQIECPFDFLKEEFEWSFKETAPGDALKVLASKFSESIFFEPPRPEPTVRKAVPHGVLTPQPVLDELRRVRDQDFFVLLAESFPERGQSGEDALRWKLPEAA
jgi:hypothetical protein